MGSWEWGPVLPMTGLARQVRALSAGLALVVGGCTLTDSFESRSDAMNRSLDGARNSMMLLNVVRAHYSHPLTFHAVTSVSGTQTATASFGLPTATFGPGQTAAQHQTIFGNNSVSGGVSSNLQITPLESREFYQGLMQPIGLNAIQFLLSQGYPRLIVFYLLVDSIKLVGERGEQIIYNSPGDPTFAKFMHTAEFLIGAGLSIDGGSNPNSLSVCFEPARAEVKRPGLGPVCGRGATNVLMLRGLKDRDLGNVGAQVVLRSTYSVFRYLGRLVDPEIGDQVLLNRDLVHGITLGEDLRLFPVTRGRSVTGCLVSVDYLGSTTCLPTSGGEQAALILQLLTQLVALNISVRDLPVITTVRIAN